MPVVSFWKKRIILSYSGKYLAKMIQTILIIFIIVLSSLYVIDRIFNIVKTFIKGERFEQKTYQRILTFLSISVLITALFV